MEPSAEQSDFYHLDRPSRSLFQRLSSPLQRIVRLLYGLGCLGMAVIVLLPVFLQRNARYSSSCLSNEKQIGLGSLMYAQDYDDTFPCGTRGNRSGMNLTHDTPRQAKYHVGQGWAGQIYPYVKNLQVFQCSEDHSDSANDLYPISYAYNRNVALNPKPEKLSAAAVTVLLAESEGGRINMRALDERNPNNVYSPAGNGLSILAATDGTTEPEASAGMRYATGILGGNDPVSDCSRIRLTVPHTTSGRHNEGANYMMTDGHAHFFKPDRVSPGDNAHNSRDSQNCTKGRAAGTSNLADFGITFSTK